eukprot:354185-Chlamydomonas_euryale.AAC.5
MPHKRCQDGLYYRHVIHRPAAAPTHACPFCVVQSIAVVVTDASLTARHSQAADAPDAGAAAGRGHKKDS